MILALKIVCGLYAALMASLGASWWFGFAAMGESQHINALSSVGVNNLTADMGALFFGTAILIALGLRAGKSQWLLSAAILMLIAAAGRILAYVTVGFEAETLVPLVFELASASILFFTHKQMSATPS